MFLAMVAFAGIVAIILITLGDIFLRLIDRTGLGGMLGLPRSVPGVLDLVEYAQVIAAQFAIALGFAAGVHVSVDIISAHFSRRVALFATVAGGLICGIFLALCIQQAYAQLMMQFGSTQVSSTLGWPLWWYWLPTLSGLSFALIAHSARTINDLRSIQRAS
jgi:TRAP-type C4-dicarboxylate transport system permease small subunit